MIWAKRRFKWAEYSPYVDQLGKLQLAHSTRYRQFMMVSTKTPDPAFGDYYIGLPDAALLTLFDGFEVVQEAHLPKVIDTLLVGDMTEDEFTSRFTM